MRFDVNADMILQTKATDSGTRSAVIGCTVPYVVCWFGLVDKPNIFLHLLYFSLKLGYFVGKPLDQFHAVFTYR